MRNEIYLEKYLKKFTLRNSSGEVQTVFEYAASAFDLCCNILGGKMSANGITVLFPLHENMTQVVVVANSDEELYEKSLWIYNKICSAADLHRAGSFDEPEVSVKKIRRLSER